MGDTPQSTVPIDESERALRLIFAYDGNDVRLVSQQAVEMILPRSDPLAAFEGRQGSWVELQDGEGRAIFRRAMPSALPTDVEALADDTGQMTCRPVEHPQGIFIALVPDLPQAQVVAVWTSPPPAEPTGPAARQAARFPLRGTPEAGQ